jgi:hypothetical protein
METHLLLPAFKLLHKEVVSLGDLAKLCIHATFEVDEVLPSFKGIPGILIPLADDFIQVSHRDLGHKWLFNGATEYGFHASVSALL